MSTFVDVTVKKTHDYSWFLCIFFFFLFFFHKGPINLHASQCKKYSLWISLCDLKRLNLFSNCWCCYCCCCRLLGTLFNIILFSFIIFLFFAFMSLVCQRKTQTKATLLKHAYKADLEFPFIYLLCFFFIIVVKINGVSVRQFLNVFSIYLFDSVFFLFDMQSTLSCDAYLVVRRRIITTAENKNL